MFKISLLTSYLGLLTSSNIIELNNKPQHIPNTPNNQINTNNNNNNNNKLNNNNIKNNNKNIPHYTTHQINLDIKYKLNYIEKYGNKKQKQDIKLKSTNKKIEKDSQTFDELLLELNLIKEKHGKLISPEVYNNIISSKSNEVHHLRSLSKKNNFIELAVFSDLECTQKSRAVGRLVNYCYNEWESSYLFKVNRKENIIVQVSYDDVDCRGIPSKVFDLQSITHTSDAQFSDCVNGVQWSYLPDYPVFYNQGAAYGSTYTNDLICDEDVKNYHGYDFRKAGFCSKVLRQNTVYVKSDVTGCEGSDEITVNYFFDSSCTGTLANSEILVQSTCALPYFSQGDDADDFKGDSSNYVVGEVHTDYCYDPTHSPTPPEPVEGSCNIPYFSWVGDGYCDSAANNPGCNYDGGDCCPQTCVSTQWECGSVPYDCIDPGAL